jgi:hypothetical protein
MIRRVRSGSIAALFTLVTLRADSTNARFSVDGTVSTLSTALATIEPRTGAPGYSWLRIYFYSSQLTADDGARARQGRVESIKTKWSAVLQLTVDKSTTVWQVDLALPGHTCTIAESDRDAKNALQDFAFDGKHVRLRGKGSHVCDMRLLKIPDQTFTWDVDLDSGVEDIR